MSIPKNPLDASGSTAYAHVIVAFKYAQDAFEFGKENLNPQAIPNLGGSIENAGPNVVIINEFNTQTFSVPEAVWDFNYIPKIGVSTSSSAGRIVVADRYNPYVFLDFLREDVLGEFNRNEPSDSLMSLSHATFMIKTYFVTHTENIDINPYYFNIDSIESVAAPNAVKPSHHILNVIGAFNSLGTLRSFTSTFQLSLTHKDGNVHDIIPTGNGGAGLKTRQDENKRNRSLRKDRLDKSKPMKTLKDVFEALEADLNQLKKPHNAQLQQWIREITDQPNSDKIVVSPEQKKLGSGNELPVDFVIDLDPDYYDYQVDNRNMPFEQPATEQDESGITVYPVKTGSDLYRLLDEIMLLSKEVGSDAIESPKKAFKNTITVFRTNENRYNIYIKIRKYELPTNKLSSDTGPGEGGIEPLTFVIDDSFEADNDVHEFTSVLNYEVGDTMLERQVNDVPGAGIVYADREQGTAERRPDLSFFQTLYSGFRPMIGSDKIDGLESAEAAGNIMNMLDPYSYTQTTNYEMIIRGNPLLLSDINRNPIDVINDEVGSANYYAIPEINPLYLKLIIYEKSAQTGSKYGPFYYTGWYHATHVVNEFIRQRGNNAGDFRQHIRVRRSDDLL